MDLIKCMHPGGNAFDYQIEWAKDRSKFKIGLKARQIGITTTEAINDFVHCLLWKESDEEPLPPVIVFCSPSARQSNRLMHYIQRARRNLEKVIKDNITFRKEREDYMHFDNFAEIFSLPNNPHTVEGIDASKGIIDELGNFIGNEDKNIYESLMGSLGAKGGGITAFGKPRGRRGLFWTLCDPQGDFYDQFSIHKFTWLRRAACDPRYKQTVEEQRSRMTSLAFQEQYECAFIDEGIVVFPWALLDKQTKKYPMWADNSSLDTDLPVYGGIDFGKKTSKTVVSFVTHGDDKTQLKYHKETDTKFDEQLKWIINLIKRFKPVMTFIDKTGLGQPLEDRLLQEFPSTIEGVQFTSATKEKLILNCRNLLEEGRLEIPEDKVLKEQMHGMEKEVMDSGRIRYTGKKSETDWMDDHAWSLCLAVYRLGYGNWDMTTFDQQENRRIITPDEAFARDLDEYGDPIQTD